MPLSDHLGGAIPTANAERTVYVVETSYRFAITWCRRSVTFTYVSPRLPRKVRRAREAELARVMALIAADIARLEQAAARNCPTHLREVTSDGAGPDPR